MTTKPLAGLRVLELARVLAGPWCGQLLADLGADVVKVERAGVGDDTREWGPPFVEDKDGGYHGSAYYHSTNRGKRSIALDFNSADDQATIRRFAKHADVVIENFKVGGLVKYGLDYPSLKAVNPRIVYCSITGFGQTGPYAPRPGYDFIIQGMGGIMSLTGDPQGEPQKVGVAYADIFTGVYSTVGILAALRQRDATGQGSHIDMALLDTQVALLQNHSMNHMIAGVDPKRMGNAHANLVPYQVVPVSDGHIILATGNDGQYRRTCEVLGVPELVTDPRFVDNEQRVNNRDLLMPLLIARTVLFAKADLIEKLEAAGVPVGPINTVPEVFRDPQVVARGMRVDLPAPETRAGTLPSVRQPIVINGERLYGAHASPALGENQDDVMNDPNWGAGA
ncbi:CaiB/BaiF CoA transferase family protein [Phreatobacter stygius]|uniref:CoA transferase n=2 Tax=Pseudomonadota TaxID=1224 RepID=A0A4D7B5S0_9HYPH|nr:CaiB/BaiF CoA-transferase family protein [Phreatobacter stygius]QCI66333.1 CoA transferase [Phreatobacter stygius]